MRNGKKVFFVVTCLSTFDVIATTLRQEQENRALHKQETILRLIEDLETIKQYSREIINDSDVLLSQQSISQKQRQDFHDKMSLRSQQCLDLVRQIKARIENQTFEQETLSHQAFSLPSIHHLLNDSSSARLAQNPHLVISLPVAAYIQKLELENQRLRSTLETYVLGQRNNERLAQRRY